MKKLKQLQQFKQLNQLQPSQSGFTLLELLIAMVILGAMLGFSLNYMRNFQRLNQLRADAQELRSVLIEAQNKALSPTPSTTETIYGYGVYITSDGGTLKYGLFKEKTQDPSQGGSPQYDDGDDPLISSEQCSNPLCFLTYGSITDSTNLPLSIVFSTPIKHPNLPYLRKTYVNGDQNGQATIKLSQPFDPTKYIEITIYASTGQVTISPIKSQ